MRIRPDQPISRARAISCALVNLAATPGLGSLMARRFIAGASQLFLGLVGFGLIVVWMFEYFHRIFLQQLGEPVPPPAPGWMGKWGMICFVVSWLWSLVTSLSLLWRAKAAEPAGPKTLPPRLANLPSQPPKLS